AARAAILEMCQMELAAPLAAEKRRERGEAALNEIDRRHLQRAAFATARCALLSPRAPAIAEVEALTAVGLPALIPRLDRHGVRLFVVDLTRADIGIAVARVVSPQLQPYATDVVTERLRRCRAISGEVDAATAGISLV